MMLFSKRNENIVRFYHYRMCVLFCLFTFAPNQKARIIVICKINIKSIIKLKNYIKLKTKELMDRMFNLNFFRKFLYLLIESLNIYNNWRLNSFVIINSFPCVSNVCNSLIQRIDYNLTQAFTFRKNSSTRT